MTLTEKLYSLLLTHRGSAVAIAARSGCSPANVRAAFKQGKQINPDLLETAVGYFDELKRNEQKALERLNAYPNGHN